MRNAQLIRQWKILIALSDSVVKTDVDELASLFGVCYKTISRDLGGLAKVGFLSTYRIPKANNKKRGRKTIYNFRNESTAVVDGIRNMMTSALRDYDARVCACGHKFRLSSTGKIDMKDYQRHIKGCAALL